MRIEDTRWYTAVKTEKTPEGFRYVNGYRMKLEGFSTHEIMDKMQQLAADNISSTLKTDKVNHTDIPAGEPFLEVFDPESVKNLEQIFKDANIHLNPRRFQIGYDYPDKTGGRR